MQVSVVGLGYVGFPLALQMASKGLDVIGVDKSTHVLSSIQNGKCHITDPFAQKLFEQYSLKTRDTLSSSDVYIVCVPTPVDSTKTPDLTPVRRACEEIASVIKDNQLVIIESTIYPGVCEDIVAPILDQSGVSYLLAHCPERINPGDPKWHVGNIPRVVGGINRESTQRAAELYASCIDGEITQLSDIKAAEATKILENTFRDINIAFINEMAQSFYRMGIDATEVIKGASTKPFAFMPHYPSVGVGGHCIAVDPYYMIQKGAAAGFDHDFLRLARRINSNMPIYTIKLIQNKLNELALPLKNTKIGVYGLAYKANIADDRESPAYEVIKRLKNREADLRIFDPHILESSTHTDLDTFLDGLDCLVICTNHKQITDIDAKSLQKAGIKLIVDGKNCLVQKHIESLGIMYAGIGRP